MFIVENWDINYNLWRNILEDDTRAASVLIFWLEWPWPVLQYIKSNVGRLIEDKHKRHIEHTSPGLFVVSVVLMNGPGSMVVEE